MGHTRLGTLSQSKKWRDVIGLLKSDASLEAVAEAAARASELDLGRASADPSFQFVTSLLVQLPLMARAAGFEGALKELGAGEGALGSVAALLAGLSSSIDEHVFEIGRSSDAGELARAALLESLSVQLRDKLPTLFEPTPQDIRKALASFASGQEFARLARDFFARLSYKSLDYYLSRELANHTGEGKRFAGDADRVEFERALSQHTFEASRIVEDFAGGWFWMYDNGEGVVEDDAEAAGWYRLAADQGLAGAQYNLGWMYASGRGVAEDDAEAVRWYRLAADQGLAYAQYNLGLMYDNGEGVVEDDAEAVRWYRLAADQGDADAQHHLGWMYANGEGVLQDNVTAHMWFNIAGANGAEDGRDNREKIERKMTPADISEAQKRARICMASNYTDCE